MQGLTIGKIAREAGLSIETIRYYEREGLVEAHARTDANYRLFVKEDIKRLRFIKRAKTLGFTLREIGDLLDLRHDPDASKQDVKDQTEAKIASIEAKIRDLMRIKQILESLDERCDGHGPTSTCPILAALEEENEWDGKNAGKHQKN